MFVQQRYGCNRKKFPMFKFRSMVQDAENQQASLESVNEASGTVFKLKRDPRVTKVGAFLRRTSIDELPQLFNVLRGEMSLVGPRPLPLRDVSRFEEAWLLRRFSVRPGLTCLWQVHGRSDTSFDDWMKLDLDYIDRWSLMLDLKILVLTFLRCCAAVARFNRRFRFRFWWLLLGLCANASAQQQPVPATYFGMTVQNFAGVEPAVEFGTVRTWDAYDGGWDHTPGLDWAHIETARGVYDFAAVDRFLDWSEKHHAETIYTFGRTPRWASSMPDKPGHYGVGECGAPARMADWDDFVRALALHVRGRIKQWELLE